MEGRTVRRIAFPLVLFLVSTGLEVSGFEAPGLAAALWIVASVLFLVMISWDTRLGVSVRNFVSPPWSLGGWVVAPDTAVGELSPTGVKLKPDNNRSGEAVVGVENLGEGGEFTATAEVVGVYNDPNEPNLRTFKACWVETETGIMPIEHGQTRHIKLAQSFSDEFEEPRRTLFHQLDLLRMEAGGCARWDSFRWFVEDDPPPMVEIEVTVSRVTGDYPPARCRVVLETFRQGGVAVVDADEVDVTADEA